MYVAEILKRKGARVATVHPDVSLAAAARRMLSERIGAVLVSEDDRRVLGILSERDIMHAVALHGEQAPGMRAGDVMTRSLITVAPEESVTRVMEIMTERRIRHVPVIANGALAGIVSIGDVVKARIAETELETRVLRDVYIASR
jgi:CBS domain-containing protein